MSTPSQCLIILVACALRFLWHVISVPSTLQVCFHSVLMPMCLQLWVHLVSEAVNTVVVPIWRSLLPQRIWDLLLTDPSVLSVYMDDYVI